MRCREGRWACWPERPTEQGCSPRSQDLEDGPFPVGMPGSEVPPPVRLRRDYNGGPPPRAAYDLIPAVASSYGGWHPEFTQWWRGTVRMSAELAGSLASQTGMLWRTVGFLSVTLHCQNFQVLAACAPLIGQEVEGLLGRPLSEDPEFWRAAPEVALLWSADEFGFPPQRWAADHSPGIAGVDYSAAGHMRAAGMRL